MHTQICLFLVTAWRQQIENCLGLWPACQDHPACTTAHTGLLLQPLLLWHYSPKKGSLLLPTRLCTLGGNRASPDHGPAWTEATITSSCVLAHNMEGVKLAPCWRPPSQEHMSLCILGRGQAQLSVVASPPPAPIQLLTKVCTLGQGVGSETSTEVTQPQALRHWPCPKYR